MTAYAFFLILSFIIVNANALTIVCDSNKNLILDKKPTEADCSDCAKFQALKEPKEFKILNTNFKDKLKISYLESGPNKVLQSPNYDVKVLNKIINLALINDLDPYLLISIVLLENPPILKSNENNGGYESGYGDLPLDALPLYDMLGCIYKKPNDKTFIYATDLQVSEFSKLYLSRDNAIKKFKSYSEKYQSFKNFLIKQTSSDGPHIFTILETLHDDYSKGCPILKVKKEISDYYCKNADVRLASEFKIKSIYAINDVENKLNSDQINDLQRAEIQVRFDSSVAATVIPNKKIPEFKVKSIVEKNQFFCSVPRSIIHGSPATFTAFESHQPGSCCAKVSGINDKKDFLNYMAARFLKSKISTSSGPLATLSLDIQKYNGLGVIGSTEGLDNKCLIGLNMKQRPYYGARAADLIINSLLSNDEIKTLIQENTQNISKSIPSILCQKLGIGTHQIDKNQFLIQQKDFLLSNRVEQEQFCKSYFK